MKVLLTVIMTMFIGSSAFAACSVETPLECTDQKSCEKLSSGTKKFTFNVKCLSADGPVVTECPKGNDGPRVSESNSALGSGSAAPSSNNDNR